MRYPNYIYQLKEDMDKAITHAHTTGAYSALAQAELAEHIMYGALLQDHMLMADMGVYFKFAGTERNAVNPPVVNDSVLQEMIYADDPDFPLGYGESWNEGRRSTHTGVHYKLDSDGKPINPYANTGLTGRGVLAHFGPNHAVDIGTLVIKDDEAGKPAIYALGITRKYDNDAKAFAGGFLKYPENEGGGYPIDSETLTRSRTEEFFEEMISGSVELLPEYQEKADLLIDDEMPEMKKAEIITSLKLEQVEEHDIGFLQRLYDFLAQGRECFAGPILNDPRSTNQSWIESQLSWVVMDDEAWEEIRGSNPKFDYRFMAGDDASAVQPHKLDVALVDNAYASHGPMFAFMAASYLADCVNNDIELPPTILKQFEELSEYYADLQDQYKPEEYPVLLPKVQKPII